MEDKLEQFYNSIKSNPSITGLPKDYATFKSAMSDSNVSAEFFKAIKQNPSITGLPEDYNTFSSALGLQKKSPIGSESTSGLKPSQNTRVSAPKVSIDGDVKNAVISLEGAQMALVNKDKEIANLDKSLAGGRDVGGSFLQVDRNLEKVVDGLDKKLAKERQFIQKSVESTIVKVKPVLNKVINEKINDATIGNFTRDVGGKIVPDETKISSYTDEIIKQTGLSEGKYVKDFIYNEVKANVSNKLTQPKIEKVFNELYKKKYGVSVEEDINKDFVDKFKDVNAVKAQAEVKLNTVNELAKADFTNEMSVVSSEFKAKADEFNFNYKQTTEKINKQAEGLVAQYRSGVISQDQYLAGINQLKSNSEANYKVYKGNFDQMADEFLKTQNAVASRYDKRLRRQYNEIDKAAKIEVENRLAKYKSQYKISPEIESRYSKTYQEAAEKFKKQEGVIDYQIDKSKGAAVILGQSLLSGLGQGIKGLSYMADFELGKVYGEYLENSFRLSESNLESMKDLLDPIKVARSSGQTIGAMAPMLAGNALIASATAGTSIPVQLAATGGFGFFMQSMQMAGDMYDRKMQETGIVADAEKAAAKVIQANTMLLPLYAFDGLPLISNATLGIKNRALRGLVKGGIEMATEITQEVPQSAFEDVIYKNKSLTDVVDKFDVTKKENRDEIFNTVLNVIPSSFLMGSAPTFLGYANKPIAEIRGRTAFAKEQLEGLTDNAMEQFFYDMQLTKGITFSKAFLSAAYSSGQVNEMQLIKLTNIVDKSAKVLEDAKELKLNNGESKVYAAYEFAADAYTKQAEAMEDGVAKEALLAKAAAIKKQAVNYLNTKEGDYVVVILPNGEQYVYQPDFFTSSVSNYNTLKNLLAKKLATAKVISSTKEGDKVKARVMSYVRILDSAPENIEEFTEEEGGMSPKIQSQLDGIAVEIGELEISLEQPSLSPESKQKIEARLSELDKIAQELLAGNQSIEYVSEGDNFFKILLDGTKEPVTEAEFDQAVSTPKPINEKNGDMVTVNFGGKAITGTVEVDEGGKASIYSGGVVYELPNDTEYVDYASPVRISDTDGSIEFDGVSYPEVRIEFMDGTETAVLIDENGKPKTVKDPKIVEEFKYQITLANLAEITEEEAITLLSEYEQDSKTKVDDATEGGVNQADEQKRSEEDIKLQEAIDEIDLIELIALEELDNADANAKLVEYKPTNSKDTKVYLVKKNADGTVSATLDGKKVRRGAVLSSLSEAYDLQSKEGSKKLATKLQEQVNALKADVEAKLFGKTAVAETPVEEKEQVSDGVKTPEGFKNRVFDSNIQLGTAPRGAHISEDGYNYRVLSQKEIDAIRESGGVFARDGKQKGGNQNTKYWTKGNGVNWYGDKESQETIRVKQDFFSENEVVLAENVEVYNKKTNKFEPLIKQEDAIKESSQQVTQGGEQGSSVQRQRADEGQQKAGERKGDERKAEKPKADRGDSIKQSREEQEKVTPKKDDSKPVGLSPLETKFKETPEALSKDELKEVLDAKRERYKKAITAIEKGDLEGDALKAKQKAINALENTIEDLVKRIDAGVVQKNATKDQAIGSEEISVKSQTKIKKSLDDLKAEFSDNETKIKVIEAVEKGISVLQSAFPSMNIVIHKSSSDFLEATGLPMVNGKVASGVFMYSGDAKLGYEGVIHIDLTNANPTVVYHEIAHALMLKTLGENESLFESFKDKVSKILSEKTAANLDAFIEPYPQTEKAEEYIVQLVAALTATNNNTNPSILMKLKVIINDFVSKITGGKIKVFAEDIEGIEVYNFLKEMAIIIKESGDIKDLQKSFNNSLLNPTVLNAANATISDVKSIGENLRIKKSIDGSKTPEQMVQSMREDEKFSNAIIDFAYLSIKLRGLKTIEAFKTELEKQLGVKFDKMPQELKDAWNEAKKNVIDEKKQAPTIKQNIKEATEQKTSLEKVATFAEYMAAKYKGMAEGEKIGQQNRFEIIKEAARYVKQAVASDVSRAKINSLINKAINIQNFDSVKSFAKYVDKLIKNQEYYAKVAELEGLAAKLGSKVKADKFGSIAPIIRRLVSINPEYLTEDGIDKYITLANELLTKKVADVTNLDSTLAQLKAEERQTIEAKLMADLMDDPELISLIDTMYRLQAENPSGLLAKNLANALSKEEAAKLDAALEKVKSKKAEIMEYISGSKMIKSAKDYVSLISVIRKYNGALKKLAEAGIISEAQVVANTINPNATQLSLLEEALKEKLLDFRKSLTDQVMVIIASINNQYLTGGIRAKLFSNLTDFEKKAYENTVRSILTIPNEVLPDLEIDELNDLFNAVEQLNNGYISPKLLESLEIIEAKGYQNSIKENINDLVNQQQQSDVKSKSFRDNFIKSVGDFSGVTALTDYMKTMDYKEISSYFYDAYTRVYAEYIYKPFERAFTKYKDILEEVTVKVISADDILEENVFRFIKGKASANVVRNVVGVFLIQADHLRNPEFEKWSDDKKNLAQYVLDQNKKKKIEADQEDIELLEKAISLIEGDVTTIQGLEDAMDKFFSKEPLAKKLYEAIRNSIDNEIAPMTKISIEREGGVLEIDSHYFPIQRRGKNFKEVENPFEDMTEKQYSAEFKRRDNATYRRVGDPFVMRDFNATRAFNKLAEGAARNYALKPVVSPFNRAVNDLASQYELNGEDDVAMFLNAANNVVFDSMKMQFQREQSNLFRTSVQKLMSFQRFILLTQVIRLGADLGGNLIKAASSMNPIQFSKYVLESQSKLKKDEFVQLARLVNSPIIFKTSRAKIENVYSSKRVKEKRADALAGWADIISASITWKALITKNFKDITGKDLDVKALKDNPTKYYLENKDALLKAAYQADLFVDKKFVTQSEIGRASLKALLPFVAESKKVRTLSVERTSVGYSLLNQMASYLANDAAVMWAATKRLTTKGDISGFVTDVFPILLSQAAYASMLSFSGAVASIAGYSIAQAVSGDDDDETILEYTKEEMDNFLSMYTDPKKFGLSYLVSLLLTSTGKYAVVAKNAAVVGIGGLAAIDINRQPDKKAKRKVSKEWDENYKVIQDKFYFRPYTFGQRGNPIIEPTFADISSAIPVLGFYVKLENDIMGDNPNKPNLMTAVKELGKDNPDKAAVAMGAINVATLTAIAFGSTIAPTINKISVEMGKTEARKDREEKSKKGSKSNKTKNPFGSSGFGSKGLSGGL